MGRFKILVLLVIMVGSAMAGEPFTDSLHSWVNQAVIDTGMDNTYICSLLTANGWFKDMADSYYVDYDSRPRKTTEWVYSIFWIDTVGWKADTSLKEYYPYAGIPGMHTLEINYRTYIRWHPVLDTTYICKVMSDKREPFFDHRLLVKREQK